jgi:hypothetical protein
VINVKAQVIIVKPQVINVKPQVIIVKAQVIIVALESTTQNDHLWSRNRKAMSGEYRTRETLKRSNNRGYGQRLRGEDMWP